MTDSWTPRPDEDQPPAGEAPSVIAEVLAHAAAPTVEDSIFDHEPLEDPFPYVEPALPAEPDALFTPRGVALTPTTTGPLRVPGGLPLILAPLTYYAAFAPWAIAFAALVTLLETPLPGTMWPTLLASWTLCFLGLGFAGYSQATSGVSDPDADPGALYLAFAVGAICFAATLVLMRDPSHFNNPGLALLQGIALMGWTMALGYGLARGIQHSGHLIAVALVGLLVDIWSVQGGPSHEIAAQVTEAVQGGVYTGEVAPPVVTFFLLRFPFPGTGAVQALLGAGDLVFLAFFFGCMAKFRLPVLRNFLGLSLGVVGAMALAQWAHEAHGLPAIPALPILAPLFVLLNVKFLRMSKHEWRLTGAFVGILVLLMAGATVVRMAGR